ncbi:MAG: translation initiation factor IF-2 [Chitinophagaceae bacterium]
MAEKKLPRLLAAAREFNVGKETLIDFLIEKGFPKKDLKPTSKLTAEMYVALQDEFQSDKAAKLKSDQVDLPKGSTAEAAKKKEEKEVTFTKDKEKKTTAKTKKEEALAEEETASTARKKTKTTAEKEETAKTTTKKTKAAKAKEEEVVKRQVPEVEGPKVVSKIDIDAVDSSTKPKKTTKKATTAKKTTEEKTAKTKKEETPAPTEETPTEIPKEESKSVENIEVTKISGPTVVGRIDLPANSTTRPAKTEKKKRKRIPIEKRNKRQAIVDKESGGGKRGGFSRGRGRGAARREEKQIDEKEIQEKIKETQAKLAGGGGKGRSLKAKLRREKRQEMAEAQGAMVDDHKLRLTEFISVSELANLMDVSFADVISKCMNLGIMVSINQRLDAEVIELVASEFDFDVEFIDMEKQMEMEEEEEVDDEENLVPRSPIVTIMGHVDHGKTSLLDYIRSANVVAGEAGGITQHVGAYSVELPDNKEITFLDTPGHEAFTAMRARGAKVTDIAVIVIAADDAVMPQTKEAISHAQAAGVPMIFAINKIDKDGANPQKIYEQLSSMNILVEDWGGKFQSQEIAAKSGLNIDKLLEKILLEAEILELKANPDREATGTIIEASLDKGRGYVATLLVENGTLHAGDLIVSGQYYGRVKALFNERNRRVEEVGPSSPAVVLGLNGAPQAGEKFKIYEDESEAKSIANRRAQILREQGIRTKKHITLDEIGRRLALGSFKELNVIIKGDVDGSVEALSDSLQKLSTQEILVNVIHKGVGQINESDIVLAEASDAVVIAFNVRPSLQASRMAENAGIEIKMYSIIYNAIEEVKSAMEGMLEPKVSEKITANVEIKEVFKFDKATIAGCQVIQGKIKRDAMVRLIRDGIVIYPTAEGAKAELGSLKRFKDDVKEVATGMECGLTIKNYSDIKVGDIVEAYEEEAVKRTL